MFQSKTIEAMEVEHQRRFGMQVEAATIAAVRIRTLIDKISRSVQSLNYDIETEEGRTRCWDCRNPAYSILARGLTTQRNNLAETATTLQKRLADAEALANTPIGSGTKLLQPA
jgi:hypothetical protein